MAMMASEVGDTETVEKILNHADTYYGPVWREGRYYYPRNDGPADESDPIKSVTAMAGNAMLPFARLNPKNGMFRLHNQMWSESYFELPYVAAVDLGAVGVRQAFYDADKGALIVGFEPGPLGIAETTFEVRNLDSASAWRVFKDGTLMATLTEGDQSGAFEWPEGGSLRVSVDVTEPVSLVLQKSTSQQVGAGQ
jgi:hypothetical protein